eukprot:1865647-Karenia_brevis.AAC.1
MSYASVTTKEEPADLPETPAVASPPISVSMPHAKEKVKGRSSFGKKLAAASTCTTDDTVDHLISDRHHRLKSIWNSIQHPCKFDLESS